VAPASLDEHHLSEPRCPRLLTWLALRFQSRELNTAVH
jgi:hypothetical protein